jgi:hypothetical protein
MRIDDVSIDRIIGDWFIDDPVDEWLQRSEAATVGSPDDAIDAHIIDHRY